MSELRVSKEDGVNYYNYADETCGDVGRICRPADGRTVSFIIKTQINRLLI